MRTNYRGRGRKNEESIVKWRRACKMLFWTRHGIIFEFSFCTRHWHTKQIQALKEFLKAAVAVWITNQAPLVPVQTRYVQQTDSGQRTPSVWGDCCTGTSPLQPTHVSWQTLTHSYTGGTHKNTRTQDSIFYNPYFITMLDSEFQWKPQRFQCIDLFSLILCLLNVLTNIEVTRALKPFTLQKCYIKLNTKIFVMSWLITASTVRICNLNIVSLTRVILNTRPTRFKI